MTPRKTLSTNTVKRDLCNVMLHDMAPQSRIMTPQSAYAATRALIHMSDVVATWMSATCVSVMSHMRECVPHEWVLCHTWVRATWMSATWVSECDMSEWVRHEWVLCHTWVRAQSGHELMHDITHSCRTYSHEWHSRVSYRKLWQSF